ncbi:N-acetyltransferase [Leucobacter sp. CSA1]|uniref:N-acetyltransferase n=1 Tax=Leucobacter chromiisoli TaxID=2796471 RepID=A0A934Q962_9MICO|nr:GNAT family N-acetyltransferase [Leucobacter chromiisoli]MBK0418944.1 N-acetyltransferase [Leucobacter chromiisoli]
MSRYVDEAQAAADGFRIEHEPERSRFAVVQDRGDGRRVLGEAHYTLLGDAAIDFDHTEVTPDLRGTGLSGLLVQHALTDPVVRGRRIEASCWFASGYLDRHPELRNTDAD